MLSVVKNYFSCLLHVLVVVYSQLLSLDNQSFTTKLTNQNHNQRHKYHHLMMALHFTPKMTITQIVETSVVNNSLSKDYNSHPDNHTRQNTDTPDTTDTPP